MYLIWSWYYDHIIILLSIMSSGYVGIMLGLWNSQHFLGSHKKMFQSPPVIESINPWNRNPPVFPEVNSCGCRTKSMMCSSISRGFPRSLGSAQEMCWFHRPKWKWDPSHV
jgi:hypothetical protein